MIFSDNAQALGAMGEFEAINALKRAGYAAEKQSVKHAGDLRVTDKNTGEIYKVEVKTARKNKRGKWQFCLEKRGKTSTMYSDYVILLCISLAGHATQYLIPSSLLEGKKSITICKPHFGRYDVFRVRNAPIKLGGHDD